jgi:hypothetical protein
MPLRSSRSPSLTLFSPDCNDLNPVPPDSKFKGLRFCAVTPFSFWLPFYPNLIFSR